MRFQTRTIPGFWGLGAGCPIPQMFVIMIGPWRLIWGWSMRPKKGKITHDLEEGAKFLEPVLAPLRNEIPPVSGDGGILASYRAMKREETHDRD